MKLFKRAKLNSKGFSHVEAVIAILVIAGIAAVGVRVMMGSHAATPNVNVNSPIIGIVGDGTNGGYWLFSPDGGVFGEGSAPYYGSMGGKALSSQIVGMSSTYDHKGYYLVGGDGAVYAFGDAQYQGGLNGGSKYGNITFPGNVIGIAAHNGGGYWIMTSTGATYAFGNAPVLGNATGSTGIVSINSSPDGKGYIAMSITGQGYNYDDDTSCGRVASVNIDAQVVSPVLTALSGSASCFMVDAGGDVFSAQDAISPYGTLPYVTSSGTSALSPVVGVTSTGDHKGYWMAEANGSVYAFGDAVLNYTTPVKYSQSGGWTPIGVLGDIKVNSAGQTVQYSGSVCKLQAGNITYVAGEISPASSVAGAALTSPQSFQNGNMSNDISIFNNNGANELPSYTDNSYADAKLSVFRTMFIKAKSNNEVMLITNGQYGGSGNDHYGLAGNMANCSQ